MAMAGLGGTVADGVEDTVEQVLLLEPRTLVLFENSPTAPPLVVVNRLRSERRIPGMEIVVVQKEAPEERVPPQSPAQPVVSSPQPTPAPGPRAKGLFGWLRKLFGRG